MRNAPPYFENVRAIAAKRWAQLEQDPVLAGPWHQLFKQVQSPRHVISELLQNADDAGATMASVDIKNDEFIFTHNGEDFTEEQFISLCRFGYSNKRSLHTVGFRGIGFKSTFSLGDEVQLRTSSLSVAFRRKRFTEPIWLYQNNVPIQHTEIRVEIQDPHRLQELLMNLKHWMASPASLLFFRSIRCLTINGRSIRWEKEEAGPVPRSFWFSLAGTQQKRVLLIPSVQEQFPSEALDEIHQERMILDDAKISFPPCSVDLVLGMEGRLFVILPTGVETKLPFACNAPFIQDPARMKIKDPETSPTNRWLLERVGKLAAEALLHWVGNVKMEAEERCRAYDLLPDSHPDEHSLESSCERIVQETCKSALIGKSFIFLENKTLVEEKRCVSVSPTLLDVWPHDIISRMFTDNNRPILSRYIEPSNRKKLKNWKSIDVIGRKSVLEKLQSVRMPKPKTWVQLLKLWTYISQKSKTNLKLQFYQKAYVFPSQGKALLYAASEISRLGEKKNFSSSEDWELLSKYLLLLDRSWLSFLDEKRRKAAYDDNDDLGQQVETADRFLFKAKLTHPTDVNQVIEQVAKRIVSGLEFDVKDCIRLAQLAATLGASVSENFHYVTRDGCCRSASEHIVYDINSALNTFVSDQWYENHVLHDAYSVLLSCTEDEWRQWIASGRSRICTFVQLTQVRHRISDRHKLMETLKERGFDGEPSYHYKTNNFIVEDWDFDDEHWRRWRDLAADDQAFWGRLLDHILKQPATFWIEAKSAKILQEARNGNTQIITMEALLPSWIMRFRNLPCLQDTRGFFRHPAALLRRTPDTESLLDVEPFVRAEFDTEATRPLLILLGVRDTPTGPDSLLDRLRALARADNPPVDEIEKWYHRLDRLVSKCSTDEFGQIKHAFANEKIILIEGNCWGTADEVFLEADEGDVPGAALVHPSARHLTLWSKVGVADRPTADLSIAWLAGLASNQSLTADEVRRVRLLLPRYPMRIWEECGHWLNIEGEWTPTEYLVYSLTMQALVGWKHLFKPIKQKTADLQKLSVETWEQPPFSALRPLAQSIEERFDDQPNGLSAPQKVPWLNTLGVGLRRIAIDDQDEAQRIRELANRLIETNWQVLSGLQTVPYIDDTPAGTPRRADVLWRDSTLYVENRSPAKVAKAVALELGRVFHRQDIADAIMLCYDRPLEFVSEYLEENFILLPDDQVAPIRDTSMQDRNTEEQGELANDEETTSADQTDADATRQMASDNHDTEFANEPDVEESFEDDDLDEEEKREPVRRKQFKPATPSLMERFAKAKGYDKDGSNRFYHVDGSWIAKVSGGHSFPWEHRSADGELLQCYWDKEHCIQRDALQLDADVLELCYESPGKYTLLLTNVDDTPLEITGHRLLKMRDGGELALFPAKYRLVYANK